MSRKKHRMDSIRRSVQERAARTARSREPPEEGKLTRRFRKADTLADALVLVMQQADTSQKLTDETRQKLVEVAEACRDE